MLQLKGRTVEKTIQTEVGKTLLDLAASHGIDLGYDCTLGTCAHCRCYVSEGADLLAAPTDEEIARLGLEEIESGFRLGCQAIVRREGQITAVNHPYS